MTRKVHFAVCGAGNVGRPLLQMIERSRRQIAAEQGVELVCTGISDSRGCALDPQGLSIAEVLEAKAALGSVACTASHGYIDMTAHEMLKQCGAELMVEALPADIKEAEPGLSLILTGIALGMDVVIVDKPPLALHWETVFQQAGRNGRLIRYGAAANAGLHTLEMGKLLGRTGELIEFSGIFNSTCPYVLEKMQKGMSFEQAIANAQALGIAERDYRTDTEGYDVAEKTVIHANAFWGTAFTLHDVDRQGISEISREMLEEADRGGKVWRFIGRADLANRYLSAKPELVDKDSPLGKAGWHDKAICMQTKSQGIQICYGIGAADTATPGTMLMDMLSVVNARNKKPVFKRG